MYGFGVLTHFTCLTKQWKNCVKFLKSQYFCFLKDSVKISKYPWTVWTPLILQIWVCFREYWIRWNNEWSIIWKMISWHVFCRWVDGMGMWAGGGKSYWFRTLTIGEENDNYNIDQIVWTKNKFIDIIIYIEVASNFQLSTYSNVTGSFNKR